MQEYSRNCVFKDLSDIKGKKVTIMGLGLNGGGEASARFFAQKGALVTVTDMKSREELLPSIERLSDLNDKIRYVLGKHDIKDFEEADCVIKNPGVKFEGNKFLQAARAIESDISIFLRFSKSPVIAVTGSKGKSSTVSAIYYGLREAGFKAFLGGNITVSPLTFLEETSQDTPVVLELSSWQLADLRGRGVLKPYISLITKIVPDHQNWYGNMESYVQDKMLIYKDQTRGDWSIFDYDGDLPSYAPENASSWGDLFASDSKASVLRYSRKRPDSISAPSSSSSFYGVWEEDKKGYVFLPGMEKPELVLDQLKVPGRHMRTNALNAALVLFLMHVPSEKIRTILAGWEGTPHRLQYFHTFANNVRFYNDSCATVPEAVCEATKAFEKPVILLTGGTDKGLSFEPLVKTLADKNNPLYPKKVFLLAGSGTDKLVKGLKEKALDENGLFENERGSGLDTGIIAGSETGTGTGTDTGASSCQALISGPYKNLTELLKALKEYILKNNISDMDVVFSPGATSFGLFKNEFDRGNQYMDGVKEIFN
ncbi:MAG: UDP-N-acetylmuramoyl-L-alanine--D-glutamate ligase [Treponema sp.]|nr:UDP-N-acetylmuramoyl-L-alanine--D-glutamate ligase [Treponema sp.]